MSETADVLESTTAIEHRDPHEVFLDRPLSVILLEAKNK